ncbi:MAG TPA: tetratricopeptide repeat protein [Solimonas sp.]
MVPRYVDVRSKLIVVTVALLLAACQTTSGTHQVYPGTTGPEGEPLSTPPKPDAAPLQVPEVLPQAQVPIPDYPKTAGQISGAAVTSLMKRASDYRKAGQPDQAAGTLERALRIEPRNYFVWSALAQAYLAQKNYAQAESMAQKSNALARGNVYVALENWKTISAAASAQGDAAGAAAADAQIAAIQARLAAAAPTAP